MRYTRGAALTSLALLAHASAPALAQGPDFRFSGFGTVGVVQVDQPGIEFRQTGQTSGAGESLSFKPDSRLGVQLDGSFNPTFSATLQVLAKHSGEGDDQPRVEWAFAKAKLGHGFTLRAGRIGAPFFAVSDFREVGYANTWLRTPSDVYGQIFLRTFDGADLLYAGDVAGVPVTAQLIAGNTTAAFTRTDIDFKNQVGVNLTAEVADGVTLRLGQINGKLTVQSATMRQLAAVLRTTPFGSVGDQIECTDRKASFGGVGVSVERGNWVGSAEYTERKTACYVPDTSGWHVMAGYRFGAFTPYAVVSELRLTNSNVVNNIPRNVNATLTTLALTVDGLLDGVATRQATQAVGVRWDAYRNIAVKAQYERVDTKGGYGLFGNVGGPRPTDPVQVLSLAVDFIF
ncbi:hypothetical protein D621_20735 [beta proteobacterium AAP51]|nr:hypothetical protein D621_20735 [beta proteobacterium AAP51]